MENTHTINLLFQILYNEYTLSMDVKNIHWNYVGENFLEIHKFMDEEYSQMQENIDIIGERLRQFDETVYVYPELITERSTIVNSSTPISLFTLISNYNLTIEHIQNTMFILGDEVDLVSADIITELLRNREKSLWLLKSNLD